MYKKWILLLIVLLFPIQVIATSLSSEEPETEVTEVQEELASQTLRYSSNQFTRPEKEASTIEVDTNLEGFESVAENGTLKVFVHPDSLALKIVDKRSGYVWSSGLEEDGEYRLNTRWRNMANSAVTITYVDDKNKETSEDLITNGVKPNVQKVEDGFIADIEYKNAGISFQLQVTLEEDSIVVHVPKEEVKEERNTMLVSMRLYPFLGAVESDNIDGYMFIPDGSGALMRFGERTSANSPYQAFVYGEDEGFSQVLSSGTGDISPPQKITMPVFGLVHGAQQNALIHIIEGGNYNSELIAYPAGVSTDFNWMYSEYHYRYQYFQPTSRSMSGYKTYQKDRNQFDIQQRIAFLADEEADYVGMAKYYQKYLVDSGKLAKNEDIADVRLEFLGGEVKKGLIWDSVLEMTRISELPTYVEKLQQQNVDKINVVYRGWSKGGLTGTLPKKFPIEKKLGSTSDFEDTINRLEGKNIDLSFYTDYTKAFRGASGYSGSTDVARKINGETMQYKTYDRDYYLLSPAVALEMAEDDVKGFEKLGISNIAIDTTTNTLFSDFNSKNKATRYDNVGYITEMHQLLSNEIGSLSLYEPNDYLWSVTGRYYDIPMYSSNYSFATDTVPFVHIVLKGYVPYYAPFSNFYFNKDEEVLRMIEYGANPSFYLTTEPSHLLMKTPSRDLYTSQFSVWEQEIVNQYELVQESLGQVEGATIESRYVHKDGVVEVTYSNGVSIIVNYTNQTFVQDGITVEATDFKVLNKGDKTS
ncbi:DUF5696 domain-containing protein [Sutcliffiella sp. NC1]|uniref:DUF5696 domain-containing protein n=1 Tax=Sutcliffiella sp. NC1 TaxID=3004096 RepID=UPI0022DDDEBC|nr:DUF5696 domain-containing protein [Sutcliffiella sp. NC1]WBL14659.1 DUF5696 domain-containing protein [Sutcliffiella sp. NC1]